MDLTKRIRNKMMKERLMFVYRGVITADNTISLLTLLEKEMMENSEFGFVSRKRLFMFVLESLQNIFRHTEKDHFAEMSLVVYSKTDSGYTVITGNVIEADSVKALRGTLEKLNKLEPEEIRSLYWQTLSTGEFSSKGGAGIGLIEMAKKTGNRLEYDFVSVDSKHSYFVVNKSVESVSTVISAEKNSSLFRGKSAVQLEKLMADNNLYLIWSGHLSPELGNEVLSFTETQLSETDADAVIRRKVFIILMEALENIARYSPESEEEKKYGMPLAMIRMKDHIYLITTGNLIPNENVGALREKLDLINSCDKTSLKELFKNALLKQNLESESTGNMGLIEIARISGNPLSYNFERINDLYSYYTLTVRVDNHDN